MGDSTKKVCLGISWGPRAAAAALVGEAGIVATAQEERGGVRRRLLPQKAIEYCLSHAGLSSIDQVATLALQSKHAADWSDFFANQFSEEKGWIESLITLPGNIRQEYRFRTELKDQLEKMSNSEKTPEILYVSDELAAAQGLFARHVRQAVALMVLDTPFSRSTSGLWRAGANGLEEVWRLDYPHSLELLVANLAGFSGFRGRMGQRQFLQLSEYGELRFLDHINELLTFDEFARFEVNTGRLVMDPARESVWSELGDLFDSSPRKSDQPISSREIDLSFSLFYALGKWVEQLGKTMKDQLKVPDLMVRGQGPLFDKLRPIMKQNSIQVQFVPAGDDPLLLAIGAGIEGLVLSGGDAPMMVGGAAHPQAIFSALLESRDANLNSYTSN